MNDVNAACTNATVIVMDPTEFTLIVHNRLANGPAMAIVGSHALP